MGTFINLDLGTKTPNKLLRKHLLFSLSWILFISIVFFRVDSHVFNYLGIKINWLSNILPLLVCVIIGILNFRQKWYFSLANIIYPILLIFWFFPKNILDKGKIYLFSHYLEYLYEHFSNWQKTLIHFCLFVTMSILLLCTDNIYVRYMSMLVYTYFFIRFLYKYLKKSFKPAELFGASVKNELEKIIEENNEDERTENKWIKSLTTLSGTKDLSEVEIKEKKITRLLLWNYGIEYASKALNSYKGKKAYFLSWGLQLLFFLFISIIYFTFMNYQLYVIDNSNFLINVSEVVKFDFFYYTLKTITFNGIDSIVPVTILARCLEISSYFVIGVFIMIIVASIIFSLRQDKFKENVELVNQICIVQSKEIELHIQSEFGYNLKTAFQEFKDIKESLKNLKDILDKIL